LSRWGANKNPILHFRMGPMLNYSSTPSPNLGVGSPNPKLVRRLARKRKARAMSLWGPVGPCHRLFGRRQNILWPHFRGCRKRCARRETLARKKGKNVYARFRKWSAIVRLDNGPFVKRMVRMRIFARKKSTSEGPGE
jgi:hypothetical protein